MATGSLDANGIWIYGEDDSEPTFSGLLNKLGDSVSDKFSGGKLLTANMPSGTVLQVASTVKADTFTTTSATFTDVTGLSVAITPTSTASKILVAVSTNAVVVSGTSAAFGALLNVLRGSTNLINPTSPGSRQRAISKTNNQGLNSAGYYSTPVNFTFLDSPATTASTTYKVQAASTGATTLYLNRLSSDDDNANGVRFVSTITVMEIAG